MTRRDPKSPDFGRLARWYRTLEFLAFGRDLERARFALLPALRNTHSVLILGEGDGRFLARLLAVAPAARIHCVEGSAQMIQAAARRLTPEQRARVTFTCADLRTAPLLERSYDAVVTLFVLDCFSDADAEALVARILPHFERDALWLFADFALPRQGWRRWRARVWLAVLYQFFGWQTGLPVRALPDSEGVLTRAGLTRAESRELQHGLLRAAIFRKAT